MKFMFHQVKSGVLANKVCFNVILLPRDTFSGHQDTRLKFGIILIQDIRQS